MAAASSTIDSQEAILKQCDLCDDELDVNWFCKDCVKTLCERCKKGHLKIEECKNHRLASIFEGVAITKLNITNMCHVHDQPFNSFCKTCEENICMKCAFTIHRTHDVSDLEEYQKELEKELDEIINEKLNEHVELSKCIHTLDECEDKSRAILIQSCETIDDRMEDIKMAVDEEGKNLKMLMEARINQQLIEFEKRKQSLNERKNVYEETIQVVQKELTLQTRSSFYKFFRASKLKLQALLMLFTTIPLNTSFVAGTINKKLIGDMIGRETIHADGSIPTNINNVNSIRSKLRIIGIQILSLKSVCFSICACPDGSIWIGAEGYVFKISSDISTIRLQVPTREYLPCCHIASLQSNDAVVSYQRLPYFMDRFTSDGEAVDFISFINSKTCAYDVSVTDHDEVVVRVSTDSWLRSPKTFLHIYSKEGELKRQIQCERTVNSFCINNDGHLIISDAKTSELIILDRSGAVLNKLQITRTNLEHLISDRYGNILGVFGGNKVCLISSDLEVELTFTIKCEDRINDICIDRDDHLLILLDGTKMIVAEYLD